MDSTPEQPQSGEDRLLSPTTAAPAATVDEPADAASSPPTGGRRVLLTGSGLVAAGLVAGAVGTFALGHHGTSTTTLQPAGNATQQGPAGTGGGPQGFPPGAQGGMDGELRLQGTLTAVGDGSITVRTTAGTATYTVTPTTQIVRDGQTATLAELQKGDPVLVHVYELNGKSIVERIFAGTMPQGSFPGGPGAPGGFAPGAQGTTRPSGVVNS
jgi:hypothetical protein